MAKRVIQKEIDTTHDVLQAYKVLTEKIEPQAWATLGALQLAIDSLPIDLSEFYEGADEE